MPMLMLVEGDPSIPDITDDTVDMEEDSVTVAVEAPVVLLLLLLCITDIETDSDVDGGGTDVAPELPGGKVDGLVAPSGSVISPCVLGLLVLPVLSVLRGLSVLSRMVEVLLSVDVVDCVLEVTVVESLATSEGAFVFAFIDASADVLIDVFVASRMVVVLVGACTVRPTSD